MHTLTIVVVFASLIVILGLIFWMLMHWRRFRAETDRLRAWQAVFGRRGGKVALLVGYAGRSIPAGHGGHRGGNRSRSQSTKVSSTDGSMVVSIAAYSAGSPVVAGCIRWFSSGKVRTVASGLPDNSRRIAGSFVVGGTCRSRPPNTASTGTDSARSAGAGS